MKLGNKSILATALTAAMFSGAAFANSTLQVEGANSPANGWLVSSEKLQAVSGNYTFDASSGNNPMLPAGEAMLTYTNDIDLNDGDKLTFDFGNTALLKGAEFYLVAVVDGATPATLVIGETYGDRISATDTTNGVSSVRFRIANAGATGIAKGSTLAVVQTTTPTTFGSLTLSAPNGSTWTNSACVTVTATDVFGDLLPGADAEQLCALNFQNQFSVLNTAKTDLTAKIDVEEERKTYVEQTADTAMNKAGASASAGQLTAATYGILNNTTGLDDFITVDSDDTVTFTFTDSAEWNSVVTADTEFFGQDLVVDVDNDELRSVAFPGDEAGLFGAELPFTYTVLGTTSGNPLSPHTVDVVASIDFDEAGFSDVDILGANMYTVGINGSTSKVASFILNPSTTGFFSWVEVANESGEVAEVEVDVVMNGETYTAVKLAAVAGESVATYGHAAIATALEDQKGITVPANTKATVTFVVTAKEDKVHVSGQTKESGNGRTTLDVYYQADDVQRGWRN